jgi:FtsP/CotA-like multicopper oxidase with cupredoxin domain
MAKMFRISRRKFLIAFGGGSASLLASLFVLSRFGALDRVIAGIVTAGRPSTNKEILITGQRLPIPELEAGEMIGGQRVFDLRIQRGSMAFVTGKQTPTFGYNGEMLGPTLVMDKGDDVVLNVTNNLGEPTITHWHGLHLPAVMDGGPHQRIEDGETWRANFTILNEPATYWYHPHLDGKTADHVYHGLSGLFIIKDEVTDNLGLPQQYGIDDIPLIVQDKFFNEDGSLNYPGMSEGVKGDTILVNGAITPVLEVPAQVVQFRLLAASNARIHNFGFSDNRQFYQIGTDGGLLETPVPLTRLLLSTGERAEILVDFGADENREIKLRSYSSERENIDAIWARDLLDISDFDVMTIRVAAATQDAVTRLPGSLATIARFDESQADTTRTFKLQMSSFRINGESMDMNRIDETVKLDDVEIWEVTNSSEMSHPFHIHDIQFLILTKNGSQPPNNERGWKDVVLVKPGETVRIIAQFSDFADPDTPFMYHCHILEHEDGGMMGQFVVV